MTHLNSRSLAIFPALFCLFLSSNAAALVAPAEECATDDQCAEGSYCEQGGSAPSASPCDPSLGADCSADIPVQEPGYCMVAPVTCTSDDDCAEYLSCVADSSGTCSSTVDGETTCSEPAPDAPKYCADVPVECDANEDCPRDFECVATDAACPDIACEVDAPDCAVKCEPSSIQFCQPRAIGCENDSECPTDWSCSGGEVETCSGGGTVEPDPGSSDAAAPAEDPASQPDPVPTECTISSVAGQCYPTIFYTNDLATTSGEAADPSVGSNDATDADGASPEGGETENAGDVGGCSVSPAKSQATSFAPWLLAVALVVPFLRRRRNQAA